MTILYKSEVLEQLSRLFECNKFNIESEDLINIIGENTGIVLYSEKQYDELADKIDEIELERNNLDDKSDDLQIEIDVLKDEIDELNKTIKEIEI